MTIGERIRYFRKQRGITQGELASEAGIHPVSIRKYETNKTEPGLPHIEKIAEALNVSSNAIMGFDKAILRIKTIGDLMGLFMALCNSHIITIKGTCGEDGLLKPESVVIDFSHLLLQDFRCMKIDSPNFLSELLNWERLNFLFSNACEKYSHSPDDFSKSQIEYFKSLKEIEELELQKSTNKLSF